MSSNIEVKRICQHCSKEFTAKTTTTKACSPKCRNQLYKDRKRTEKVKQSNIETTRTKTLPIEQLKAKEFLSINEVCQLVGISRRTVYRLIEQGDLKKTKVGSRTLIKRSALDSVLGDKSTEKPEIPRQQINDLNEWRQAGAFDIQDCYTLTEIQEKYKVSESTIQQLIKRNSIPKIKKGWYAYVPKQVIDEILS